ncbi:MAG: hypothetical protein QQN41_09215 [Nitrosopumilus sp.]
METILIGLDESLLIKILPSIIIIIGFGITIWRIRAEANTQRALVEGQNKWEQDEKLRDKQEKYFEDYLILLEKIAVAKRINEKLFIKLQSSWIKSLHLFEEEAISSEFEKALNIIHDSNLTSVPSSSPSIQKYNKASEEVDKILASYLDLLIEYFKSDN